MLFRTPRNHLTKIVKANSRNFKKNWIFAIMGETEKELASSNISTCSLGFSDREEENDKMTKLHKKVQFLLNWISTGHHAFLPDFSLFLALDWIGGGYHVSDARKVWKRSPSPARWNFCFRFLIKPRKIWSFDRSLPSAPPSKVSYFDFHSSQGRWCVLVIAVIITIITKSLISHHYHHHHYKTPME